MALLLYATCFFSGAAALWFETPWYDAGARDAELELEIGARAMAERDYEGAAQHLALVTEGGRGGRARLFRVLALGLPGREAEARRCLHAIEPGTLSPSQARSAAWLERFRQGGP